jgi:3-hydroxymyristoyl/3-hydroxydecanoyl-(acyl carrier protein) dehydratase
MDRGEATYIVPRDHPAFEGHFPARPILPGVIVLAEALAAIEKATAKPAARWLVESAKFLSPVEPGESLTLSHASQPSGAVRFEVRAGSRVVAHGVLSPKPP